MISTKYLISAVVLISGIVFVALTFSLFGAYYYNETKSKVLKDNKADLKIALNILSAKTLEMQQLVSSVGRRQDMQLLFQTGKIIDVDINLEKNPVKITQATRLDYYTVASNLMFSMVGSNVTVSNTDIEFFNDEMKYLGGTKTTYRDFDEEYKRYYKQFLSNTNTDANLSGMELVGQDIIIRAVYSITNQMNKNYGYISTKFVMGTDFLNTIKNYTGKDVIISVGNNIRYTTMYNGTEMLLGNLNIKNEDEDVKMVFGKEARYFHVKKLYSVSGGFLGYIGVGVDPAIIEQNYSAGIGNMLIAEIILIVMIMFILTMGMGKLFNSLDRITMEIPKMESGEIKEMSKSNLREIDLLVDNLNKMNFSLGQREQELKEMNENLEEMVKERTIELEKAQDKIVQMEKVLSVGIVVGGVAHELNSPLQAITTSLELLKMDVVNLSESDLKKSIIESTDVIKDGVSKIGESIKNLSEHTEIYKQQTGVKGTEGHADMYFQGKAMSELVEYSLNRKKNKK